MSKKHIRDFRLDESFDERGRVKTTAVYIGGEYIFTDPEAAGRKGRLHIAALTALCWPLFVIPFIPVTQAGKLIYAALPSACNIIAIGALSVSARSLARAGETMRHEQAMKLSRRLPVCSFFIMTLSGIAALSVSLTAIISWKSLPLSDGLFLLCSAALCATGTDLFRRCRKLKVIKRENVV